MDLHLPWTSDFRRGVPFFAAEAHSVSIKNANERTVAKVPIVHVQAEVDEPIREEGGHCDYCRKETNGMLIPTTDGLMACVNCAYARQADRHLADAVEIAKAIISAVNGWNSQ